MQTIAKSLFTLIFLCLWPCLSDNWHCGLYHSVCNSTKITLVQKINDIHDSYLVPFCLLLLTFFQFQGFIYEISIVCLKSVNHWATLLSSYLLISLFGVKFILIHGLFLNRKLVDSGAVQGPIIFFPFFLFFFFSNVCCSSGSSSWTSGSMNKKKDLDWRKTISRWEGINIVEDSEKEK